MSQVIKQMKKVQDRVKVQLVEKVSTRDSDNQLWCSMIKKKVGATNLNNITGKELLKMIANGQVESFESVSRMRRRLQEKNPSLRGKKWNLRHAEEKEVRKQINKI